MKLKENKMRNLSNEIAKTFDIAVIDNNQRIWFFRTNGGAYYHDYCINNFIGLGWDKIDKQLILSDRSAEIKKEIIEDIYPDEKRPGLILGQMNTFYNKMHLGDLVLIPSEGGKEISIGVIGDLIDEIHHVEHETEYLQCEYIHKRRVDWIKKVDLYQDVYLFRALRGQQTISDITDCAELVLRNLYPVYISNNSLHLTLKKTSDVDYSLHTNVSLCSSIIAISEEISRVYNGEDFKDSLKIKTAVGSPGFIEIIADLIPEAAIAIGVIFNFIIGKIKSDGSASGLLGVLGSVNSLVNDRTNRKKIEAETERIKAETEKIKVETKLLERQLSVPDLKANEDSIMNIQIECNNIIKESLSAGIVCELHSPEDKAS